MKLSKFLACGMALLDSLPFWIKDATATEHNTRATSFRGSSNTVQVAALAHASLNTLVNASDPDVGISREDVLNVYPSNFIVDWDGIRSPHGYINAVGGSQQRHAKLGNMFSPVGA
jgi:hypothetical protein